MKISHSAKDTYLDCGYKYFLHYMLKLRPTEEKSPLVFGDAVDCGLNTLLETRDLAKAKEEFLLRWNLARKKNISYSKSDYEEHTVDDLSQYKTSQELNWASLKGKGLLMLEEYDEQIMPRIKAVKAVQLNRFISNGSGDLLNIKTDFICEWEDGRIILFDNKTSSMAYKEDSVRTSKQLATYYEMLKEEYKIEACGYIVIPKRTNKKKKPRVEIKVIIDTIPEETIEDTFQDYEKVLAGVKAAKFEQNRHSCVGKFGKCPYYDFCLHGDKTGLEEKSD